MLATILAAGAMTGLSRPAQAQFFFWDRPKYSEDDVARLAIQHGFRPLSRPSRNDDVYVADVIDQRDRRERLVFSADTGEILQRYYLDAGRGYRRFADPSIPRGPLPPGRIPDEDSGHNQFSRLSPGDRDADPGFFPDDQERPQPRPPRVRRPRTVEQAPETVHQAPVESAPLAPAAPAPAPLRNPAPPAPAPAQAALPPPQPAAVQPTVAPPVPAPTPPADKPTRSISRDPLAIPGTRERDDEKAAASKAATASPPAAQPAPRPPAKTAAPVKPAVPVAPLE